MSKGGKCQCRVTTGKLRSQKIIEILLSHMWFEFQGKNVEFKVTNNVLCQSFRRKLFRHWYWGKWLLSKYTEHFSTEIKIQLFKIVRGKAVSNLSPSLYPASMPGYLHLGIQRKQVRWYVCLGLKDMCGGYRHLPMLVERMQIFRKIGRKQKY